MSNRTPLYELPFAERRLDVASTHGVTAVCFDWGGDGPPLVIQHATGMHAHAYAPLAARLRSQFHVYAFDVRGQGDASLPPDEGFGWTHNGDDVSACLDAAGLSGRGDVYGIGHSQGGALLMMAAGRRPSTFAGMFAYEAVVFPPLHDSRKVDNVMAVAARRRREVFASREDAYENYRSKPPFSGIDDECLRAYVEWGFEDLDDGTVRLKCRPETEARTFEAALGHTNEICALVSCPTTVGLGEYTSEGFKMCVPLQETALPHGRLMHFPGRTHFGPMERTDEMAAIFTEALLR